MDVLCSYSFGLGKIFEQSPIWSYFLVTVSLLPNKKQNKVPPLLKLSIQIFILYLETQDQGRMKPWSLVFFFSLCKVAWPLLGIKLYTSTIKHNAVQHCSANFHLEILLKCSFRSLVRPEFAFLTSSRVLHIIHLEQQGSTGLNLLYSYLLS